MIDITKIKEGDTIHFRNGGKSLAFLLNDSEILTAGLGGKQLDCYGRDGSLRSYTETDFDIVRVEPKEPKVLVFWHNLYSHGFGNCHDTEQECRENANGNTTPLGMYKITISEDGSEDKIERIVYEEKPRRV